MKTRTITIELIGETETNLEDGHNAALDSIGEGNLTGCDRNETGAYIFTVKDGEV